MAKPKLVPVPPDPRREPGYFQKVGDANLCRSRCVWYQAPGGPWKCCLCGAVVRAGTPPADRAWDFWCPAEVEDLTEEERNLCPP